MKSIYTFVLFTIISVTASSQTLVPSGAIWKYLDNGSNQGSAWVNSSFSDVSWKSGPAKLGYGDPVATVVSYGSSSNKYMTTYFRHAFQVANVNLISSLNLSVMRDDGAAVYINGVEVFRTNLPASATYITAASSTVDGSAETTWYSSAISPSILVNGLNTIAVEVHQRSGSSSDITFDLKLLAVSPIVSCPIPSSTSFTNTNITSSSATCGWAVVSGATSYNIQYGTVSGVQTILAASSNSITLTGLSPSSTYNFSVQSVCNGVPGDYSTTKSFLTLAGTTSTCGVANTAYFTCKNKTSNSATCGWATVSGAISYNIKYGPRGGAQTILSSSTNSINLSGLASSTLYDFYIQTICSGGTSVYSTYGMFTTLAGTNTAAATVTRGAYLQMAGSSSITVQWRTDVATNSEVRVGTNLQNLVSNSTNSTSGTEHVIQLSGLLPSTLYYYSVGAIGQVQQGDVTNSFITAPALGSTSSVRFWATGDFGNGSATQRAVRDAYANYSGSAQTNGWLWLGDNAYSNGTDNEYQANVFNQYPLQLKKYPLFPALGNHDYAQSGYLSSAARGTNFAYFSIFSLPTTSGSEKYYSYNYGNIHFVVLDSYGSYNTVGSPMYNWLQADLQANTQRWVVAYWHHPPYTKGSHDSDSSTELVDMRNNIVPLLDQYGVDLVLSGHSHAYERSKLIRGHYGLESTFNSAIYPTGNVVQNVSGTYPDYFKKTNQSGTVYVVCGTSGEINGASAPGYPHNAMQYSNLSTAGSLVIEVTGDRLDCKYLTTTGAIPDQFTIIKTGAPSPRLAYTKEKIMQVFPNPNNGLVNIQCPEIEGVSVSLISAEGKVLSSWTYEKIGAGEIIPIDMRDFSAGYYFLRIAHQSGEETHTIIRN